MTQKIIVRIPELDFYYYQLLIKALQYYRNSSTEFSIDGDVANDIYILISIIEEKIQMIAKEEN